MIFVLHADALSIRRIESADNGRMKSIIQHGLASFGLDVPGTAYYDPQLGALSDFYDAPTSELGRAYFVVIDSDDHVLGGAGYAHFSGLGPEIAELQKLYISPQGQGSGASYRLIDCVERAARSDGYRQLYLETHHALVAAMHVYERCGFTQLATPLATPDHLTMDRFYLKSL
ncbi:GNAT family N-acetyltransferase [Bifidobacterium aquikefiri]|uniref:GNAT family N-acetyltransferase n=2 Tax=Bifidobacterium aquikefiri TaxID=1653207 RepID=A0A261G6D7_9BIFI|nr:GNAT family N-acetyltransferase [Bifidobacterium aquikefiri]